MSIRTVQSSAMLPRHTTWFAKNMNGTVVDTAKPWVRNPSWLAMPTVVDTDQKFVGLVAVFPESSFLALTASGAYTIDWGDGTVENIAANSRANHLYDFNAAALANSNAPVTLIDAGDLVTRTAHGYSNGMEVRFYNITATTGLSSGQVYYVINATANTFQVAATVGGAALALTGDGTATLLPYKQALVTVTPQAGQNLTALNLNIKHLQAGLQAYDAGWLDLLVGSPNFTPTGLVLAASSTISNVRMSFVEQVIVKNLGNTNDLSYRFFGMGKLRSVVLPSTSTVTNMNYMFSSCYSLQTVPLLNTAAVTSMNYMFSSCYSLQTVPLLNTAAVTNISGMFSGCYSLQTVPLLNTAAVTNISGMFQNCYSLQSIPALVTTAVSLSANFGNIFTNCSNLARIQAKNFGFSLSVANCKLSATALNEIYTNLPTVTGQTITVTGNYGTAADDPTIATNKGWTVTG